jgi:polygalacturonase
MGSEVTGSILHVLVDRCKFNGTGEVVRIKSMASRGGLIEDVIYRDCQLSNVRDAFEFDMNWLTGQERAAPASVLTHVREFQVINVTGTAQQLGKLVGIDTTQLQDIKWVNCNITAQRPMTIDTVSDVDLSGLHATVASGKPFTVKNSDTILFPTTSPSAVPTSATGARRSGVGARG